MTAQRREAPATSNPLGAVSGPEGAQDVFFARPAPVALPLMVRAEGVWLWDDAGNRYIDMSSGPVVSNLGHGNPRIAQAMADQARTLDFAYSRVARHRPNMELSARLSALAGPGYERVCLASGGSEAMEIALKFLRQHALAFGKPEKRRFITLDPSYHGGTISTLAISGDPSLDAFVEGFAIASEKVPAPFQYRVPAGHDAQSWRMACADALEQRIRELGPETVLAFVIEPVGGLATGALVMPPDYMARVHAICAAHGIAVIHDEVLCGAGRTGQFLAGHATPGARADLVVLAKGLGAGYAPLGAMLAPAAMVDALAERTGFNFSHTYNANPISCAVGLAVLDEYERLGVIEGVAARGARLRAGLERLATRHACIGDIRGAGLLMAVELVADRATRRPFPGHVLPTELIRQCGLQHELVIYSRRTAGGRHGDWFMVSPPLTITEDEIDMLIDRLDRTLEQFAAMAGVE